jgi:hypothetical protein
MVHILTVNYNKKEERILIVSNVLGICIGIPAGLLLGYWIGFLRDLKLAAASSIGWAVFIFKIGSTVIPLSWATTIALCLLFFRRRNEVQSKRMIERIVPGTLFFPLTMAYSFLVEGLVIFPVCFLLFPYLNPVLTMYVGALALLPFMVLIVAMLLPETPAGKRLRHYIERLRKTV